MLIIFSEGCSRLFHTQNELGNHKDNLAPCEILHISQGLELLPLLLLQAYVKMEAGSSALQSHLISPCCRHCASQRQESFCSGLWQCVAVEQENLRWRVKSPRLHRERCVMCRWRRQRAQREGSSWRWGRWRTCSYGNTVQQWKLKKAGEMWLISGVWGCTCRAGRVEQAVAKISKGKQQAQLGPLGSQQAELLIPSPPLHSAL